MADIITLKDLKTKEPVYPRTHIEAVIDDTNTPLDTIMQIRDEEVDGKLTELARGVIYDVSANNDGATFASLSVLLSSENLSTLIPKVVRCGGMNIRFVQSSDNKYVQWRYTGTSISNTDFVKVKNWQFIDQLFYAPSITIKNQTEFDENINLDNRKNGVIAFTPKAGVTFASLPDLDYSEGCVIVTIRQVQDAQSNLDKQIFFCKGGTAMRVYFDGMWYPWGSTNYNEYKTLFQSNGSTAFDVSALKSGVFSFASNSVPTGLPSDISYSTGGIIITTKKNDDSWTNHDRQFLITENCLYERVYFNEWTDWFGGLINRLQETTTNIPDIDLLKTGINSFVSLTVPSGYPNLDYTQGGLIITVRQSDAQLTNNDHQYVLTQNGLYTRAYFTGTWHDWYGGKFNDEKIIECGAGKQYTTLRAAMDAAIQKNGTKVVVYPGTYDLTQEFATELTNHSGSGILLSNDVHVFFMPGAYVTCMVDVSNEWAYTHFEPFRVTKTGNGNFILENANIKCKNTRYNVHDEISGSNLQYTHKYINCVMEHLDENPLAYYVQCIGGGLGTNGYIEIIGGKYKSTALYYIQEHYTSPDDMQQPITYHNGSNADYEMDSKIVIRDVYLDDKGYLRFGNYGNSTTLTPVFVSGCRMYKPVFLMNENWSASQRTNFEINSFNNEIVNQ